MEYTHLPPCIVIATISDMDIYRELVAMRERGEGGALCTIVKVRGSAPQGEASKMLVRADGAFIGTVGGGCMEAEVLARAKDVMRTGKASLETFTLTEKEMGPGGHVCGGQVEIYIETIEPPHEVLVFGCGHVGRAVAEVHGHPARARPALCHRGQVRDREQCRRQAQERDGEARDRDEVELRVLAEAAAGAEEGSV